MINQTKIIIGWGSGIRRSVSLSNECGMQDIQIKYTFTKKYLKPLNYIINTLKTIHCLIKNKPSLIVVVIPPTLILYSVFIYKTIFNQKCSIVLDCHNGVLRSEWKHVPFIKYLFNKSDKVISHNRMVKKDIDQVFGVDSVVLGDPLIKYPNKSKSFTKTEFISKSKINVLVPVSYAKDEPIQAIINAASSLHDSYNFIMTGRYTKVFKENSIFKGVTFTGFISNQTYVELMDRCDIMLCLTTDDKIQMCALIEAISMKKNVVCSNNTVNNDIFDNYKPTYTDMDEKSIASAITICIENSLNTKGKEVFIQAYSEDWIQQSQRAFV